MQLNIASIAAAGLLAFVLSACGSTPEKTAAAEPTKAAEAAKPALTPEAQQALAAAEADWKKAKSAFTLWTTTDKAFKDAQEAAKAGDSAAVIKLAKKVSGQVKIAMEQQNYPSTEMK
jgi:murein lipoprotein